MVVSGRELVNELASKGLNYSFIMDWYKSINDKAALLGDDTEIINDMWVKIDSLDLTASLVETPVTTDNNYYSRFREVINCLLN